MLVQRGRRWDNIKPTLGESLVFAGLAYVLKTLAQLENIIRKSIPADTSRRINVGLPLNQHWFNVLCLLGSHATHQKLNLWIHVCQSCACWWGVTGGGGGGGCGITIGWKEIFCQRIILKNWLWQTHKQKINVRREYPDNDGARKWTVKQVIWYVAPLSSAQREMKFVVSY